MRKKPIETFLNIKKNYSNFFYFNHTVYRNFQKTFQLLVLSQTALILVNYFAVVVWFFCCVLNSYYYFLISSLQISLPCLNALMLIYCQCEKAQVLKIFQSPCLYLIRCDSVFIFHFSSNKDLVRLFILRYWSAVLIAGRHLKEEGAYFKVGGTFLMTL